MNWRKGICRVLGRHHWHPTFRFDGTYVGRTCHRCGTTIGI